MKLRLAPIVMLLAGGLLVGVDRTRSRGGCRFDLLFEVGHVFADDGHVAKGAEHYAGLTQQLAGRNERVAHLCQPADLERDDNAEGDPSITHSASTTSSTRMTRLLDTNG